MSSPPSLTKIFTVIFDLANATFNLKRIPSAIVEYTILAILITNLTVALTADTVVITDTIVAGTSLCVGAVWRRYAVDRFHWRRVDWANLHL